MKTALVYFPYPPFPVRSGGQWRCASIITALIANGYEVTVVSAGVAPPCAQEAALAHGVNALYSVPDLGFWGKAVRRVRRHLKIQSRPSLPPEDPALNKLLREVAARHGEADLLVVNFADNHWVRNILKGKIALLDTLDLVSVGRRIGEHVTSNITIKEGRVETYTDAFLDLKFYNGISLMPSEDEVRGCKGYDAVLMIAEKERAALSSADPGIELEMVPPSACVRARTGGYGGTPVFASGPNLFNIQGLISFQENVLPEIKVRFPDFRMAVTGAFVAEMPFKDEVIYLGVVPDLNAVYQESGFAIVPTFGGTGQQLKVVEAMGAGLAVVAYSQRVDAGMIDHGVDGFLASDEREFVGFVIQLWSDIGLRESMGRAAREKVRKKFSQEETNRQIGIILNAISICPAGGSILFPGR